eukprot:2783285-Prymnesium_polylepis.1
MLTGCPVFPVFCADGAPIGSWWRDSGPGWQSRDVGEASMESILVDFAPSMSGAAPIYGRVIDHP